jgi:hypothetical protein
MPSKQAMRYLVVEAIKKLEKGTVIKTRDLYSVVYSVYPEQCEALGFTPTVPIEERWKKDIRFGLEDAQKQGLIEHVGSKKSGVWKRI